MAAAMNYKHIYHAGNFADVAKHVALLYCLDALKRKDAAFFVLDTHAGRGSYDLQARRGRQIRRGRAGRAAIDREQPLGDGCWRPTSPRFARGAASVSPAIRVRPH